MQASPIFSPMTLLCDVFFSESNLSDQERNSLITSARDHHQKKAVPHLFINLCNDYKETTEGKRNVKYDWSRAQNNIICICTLYNL